MEFLPSSFYADDTEMVARQLLGKMLIRRIGSAVARCRIVETEAYFGQGDPASHAARGRTKRNSVMFGQPGRAYVYLNYGMHHLFNIVTQTEGLAGAVLIRAVEPVYGVDAMRKQRPVEQLSQLTNGPAKLTQALAIDLDNNGQSLDSARLGVIVDGASRFKVISGPRVGITVGKDRSLRFYIEGNQFVSRRLDWPRKGGE